MYICMPGEIVARTQRRAEEDAKNDAVEGDVAYYNDDIYLDEPYVRVEAKVGRKDTCPCGSGKKYKKCCLNVDETGKDIF